MGKTQKNTLGICLATLSGTLWRPSCILYVTLGYTYWTLWSIYGTIGYTSLTIRYISGTLCYTSGSLMYTFWTEGTLLGPADSLSKASVRLRRSYASLWETLTYTSGIFVYTSGTLGINSEAKTCISGILGYTFGTLT